MRTRTKLIIGSVALAAAVAAGGTAMADRGADHDQPITGDDLERASAAALAHTGEGRVTDTEVGDEESAQPDDRGGPAELHPHTFPDGARDHERRGLR